MTDADWPKALAGVVTTALGVLLGLLGNGYVMWLRERRAYRAMLRSIASEAASNRVVLRESFLPLYDSGVVLREFSTTAVVQCIGAPLFVRAAHASHLESIHAYLRNLRLANAYREKTERLRMFEDEDDEEVAAWLDGITTRWAPNLEDCRESIEIVAALGGAETAAKER